MSTRHWLLLLGSLLAVVVGTAGGVSWWAQSLLLLAGALVGVWAFEGVRARARAQGVDIPPL